MRQPPTPSACESPTGSERDFIVISSTPGTALSFGGGKIKTDAAALVIRTDKKGKVVHAFNDSGIADLQWQGDRRQAMREPDRENAKGRKHDPPIPGNSVAGRAYRATP